MTAKKSEPSRAIPARPTDFFYPRHDLFREQYFDMKSAMYSELSRQIPRVLPYVKMVETGAPHAAVIWTSQRPIGGPQISDLEYSELILTSDSYQDSGISFGHTWDPNLWPQTAGEVIAFVLAEIFDVTEESNAPVRLKGNLAKTTINWIAYDLFDGYIHSVPGPFLNRLLFKILKVDRLKHSESKQHDARSRAAWVIAQTPDLDSQTIAQELDVDRSSVSRWRREKHFQKLVSNISKYVAKEKEAGAWPPDRFRSPQSST